MGRHDETKDKKESRSPEEKRTNLTPLQLLINLSLLLLLVLLSLTELILIVPCRSEPGTEEGGWMRPTRADGNKISRGGCKKFKGTMSRH